MKECRLVALRPDEWAMIEKFASDVHYTAEDALAFIVCEWYGLYYPPDDMEDAE